MMGKWSGVRYKKLDGKLNRVDFEFGGNSGYTHCDTPDKGWTYIPMRSDKSEAIPADRLKQCRTNLIFPGACRLRSKGNKAVLQEGNCKWFWSLCKIKFYPMLPEKSNLFYRYEYNNLFVQMKQMGEAGGPNGGAPKEIVTDFSDC